MYIYFHRHKCYTIGLGIAVLRFESRLAMRLEDMIELQPWICRSKTKYDSENKLATKLGLDPNQER